MWTDRLIVQRNFIKSNVFGVYNLLEVLRKLKKNRKKQIKLLHVSTDEVYGDLEKNKFAKENTAYNPSSPYSASKASADQLVKAYTRTYGLKTVIANPCNNYGPNQFPEKFIPKIIFNILNNRPLPLYGNGKNVREWIFVKDNCKALLKIFLKGKVGQNYNIGTGIQLKNIEILNKILTIAKKIKLRSVIKIKFSLLQIGPDMIKDMPSTRTK
jgi:dTDP-glucose 4,6-dehydratase